MVHVRFINDQETVVTVPVRPDVDRWVLAVMPVKIKLELLRDTLGVNGGRDTDAAFTQHEQDRFVHMGLLAHFTQIYHLYNLLIYNILRRNLQLFITEFCIFSPCIIFISNKNSDKSIEILHISPKYITSVDNLMIHIFSSTFNFLYSFTPSDRLESKS